MTNQELFDTCLNHLRKQGKRSVNSTGDCLYRAPDGSMCAVGALIPDDKYSPDFENRSVGHAPVYEAAGLTTYQVPLARDIQRAMHDINGDRLEHLELNAQKIAADYKLEYS